MDVTKASGERQRFRPGKIYNTCRRAGASKEITDKIVQEVKSKLYDGMPTSEISKIVLRMLRPEVCAAAKYRLKQAIMELGPDGFVFEEFIASLLQSYGFKARVGRIFMGKCVGHEVDVQAVKDKRYMVECKYHNFRGIHTDVKVAMYTNARFLDLSEDFDAPWLICNTKFTPDAIAYAECQGIKITGWRYPEGSGLESMIEEKKHYPVSVLRSVDRKTRSLLAAAGIVTARAILDSGESALKEAGIATDKTRAIISETEKICELQ
ncbi:MAG: restriction endonuclease [Candidatus Aenigmarchaeota archaeon]|nr:restriction endonuclease [Candidatus Aenigmarchaeota archaeon]